MGVYHFAGLGRSIGAITAGFSYLGALRAKGGHHAEQMFGRSGESGESLESRGLAEALVLFTTEEIANNDPHLMCEPFTVNHPGHTEGRLDPGGQVRRKLLHQLRRELSSIARLNKAFTVYWCHYARHRPIETFERVVRVLHAAKPAATRDAPEDGLANTGSRVGKEIWINLTGGSNIINSALQLATSLTGTPARIYYLLSESPKCIRHTVRSSRLGTDEDHFWVDLPVVYLNFSPAHRLLLEKVTTEPEPITFEELRGWLFRQTEPWVQDITNESVLVHTYLRPLIAQRFISHERSQETGDTYRAGPAWRRLARYWEAMSAVVPESDRSLTDLERESWFHSELLELV
jgi:hypothetical protein